VGSEAAPTGDALRSAARGVDIIGGAVTAHGLAIEWWSRMTGRPVEALLDEADPVPPGASGLLALPYFEGERSPRWERALRAEIVGLDDRTTPGEVMRALLEGCAFGLRHIVETLGRDGVELRRLVVSGSPARSRLWSQIKADVLGVPVKIPDLPRWPHAVPRWRRPRPSAGGPRPGGSRGLAGGRADRARAHGPAGVRGRVPALGRARRRSPGPSGRTPDGVTVDTLPRMATVRLNGIDVHYERRGCGPRLLFLNGSGATLEAVAPLLDI
jgi:hypothetical protein